MKPTLSMNLGHIIGFPVIMLTNVIKDGDKKDGNRLKHLFFNTVLLLWYSSNRIVKILDLLFVCHRLFQSNAAKLRV